MSPISAVERGRSGILDNRYVFKISFQGPVKSKTVLKSIQNSSKASQDAYRSVRFMIFLANPRPLYSTFWVYFKKLANMFTLFSGFYDYHHLLFSLVGWLYFSELYIS